MNDRLIDWLMNASCFFGLLPDEYETSQNARSSICCCAVTQQNYGARRAYEYQKKKIILVHRSIVVDWFFRHVCVLCILN